MNHSLTVRGMFEVCEVGLQQMQGVLVSKLASALLTVLLILGFVLYAAG